MKKRFLWTICLLLAASAAHAAAGDTYYVVVSDSAPLNIREGPSREANVLTTAGRGEALTPTGHTDGQWVEVYTDCYTYVYRESSGEEKIGPLNGWVMMQYLSEEPPYERTEGTITNCREVKFRSEPVVSRRTVLRKLQAGETVSLLAVFELEGTRWYRVRYGEDRGFVMAAYVGVEE